MIRTEKLTKRYGEFAAVDGVSLSIGKGEIYGFLGPNGAGKTTTINMLLGIVRPTSGHIWLFDEPYSATKLDVRRRIGVVPEKHPTGVWNWMTAGEYLHLFADLFGVQNPRERIDYLLERVRLSDVKDRKYANFSRGMLQKLSIVRALLHDPEIMLLDEPISGLDPVGVKQIRDLILEENREGRTVVISSHVLSEIEKICHRVAIIHHGKLMAEDKMQNLVTTLAAEQEVEVELEELPPELPARVKSLDYVRDAVGRMNTLIVTLAGTGDHRKELSKYLIDQDLVPLRIYEKNLTLEDVFLTITKENIDSIAAMARQ